MFLVIFDLAHYGIYFVSLTGQWPRQCSHERYKTFETTTFMCLPIPIPMASDKVGAVFA